MTVESRPAPLGLVWGLEWRRALARTRLLALNLGIPLLLVAPVAAAGAPPFHAASVYAVLFVLFGIFGSAIPLVRDAERGFLGRLRVAGMPPGRLLVERCLASAVLDLIFLAPAAGVVLAAAGSGVRSGLLLALVLVLTLVVANLAGAWIAAAAGSLAEAALFAAVAGLLLLHASGAFRTPTPGSWGALLEAAAPFRPLHDTLLAAASGSPPGAGHVLPAAAWAASLALATAAAAPALIDRMDGPGRG